MRNQRNQRVISSRFRPSPSRFNEIHEKERKIREIHFSCPARDRANEPANGRIESRESSTLLFSLNRTWFLAARQGGIILEDGRTEQKRLDTRV